VRYLSYRESELRGLLNNHIQRELDAGFKKWQSGK
jgi:hypothetical protein